MLHQIKIGETRVFPCFLGFHPQATRSEAIITEQEFSFATGSSSNFTGSSSLEQSTSLYRVYTLQSVTYFTSKHQRNYLLYKVAGNIYYLWTVNQSFYSLNRLYYPKRNWESISSWRRLSNRNGNLRLPLWCLINCCMTIEMAVEMTVEIDIKIVRP